MVWALTLCRLVTGRQGVRVAVELSGNFGDEVLGRGLSSKYEQGKPVKSPWEIHVDGSCAVRI